MKKTQLITVLLLLLLLGIGNLFAQDELKIAPYDSIRWKKFEIGQTPEVHVQGTWYELLAVDKYSVDEIIEKAAKSQRRFDEDLISKLVKKMGFAIPSEGTLIDLKVRELDTKKIKPLKVPLTKANRETILNWAVAKENALKVAPYDNIRWEKFGVGETPEVHIQGKWVELLAVANYSVDEIIEKAAKSQKIFDEWLINRLVKKMGYVHPTEGSTINLSVRELDTKKIKTLKSIPLTKANFNSIIAVRNAHLAPGAPSPSFSGYTPAGKEVKIEDLRGKVVYIDVWATWCGPCRKQIPFLKKIEKEYHNKNIVFVSLSVDKVYDKDKWKKFVVDNKLGGIQLIDSRGMGLTPKSVFKKKFEISGIPRFILIDAEGEIVSAKAPRPSNPDELRPLLDKTLKVSIK